MVRELGQTLLTEAEKLHQRSVSWENIHYTVQEKSGKCTKARTEKTILHNISGRCGSSECMAVMGSSGAGKTTFLNILANQVDRGKLSGLVKIGNEPLDRVVFRKYCGYVRQDDVLLPNLTVEETIQFYANLRLPKSMSKEEKKQRVDITIRKLGLQNCRHTYIGGNKARGISGGEKRRVSIAVELIRNPPVLFLDEPTSGLDTRTALSVMNCLADLAHEFHHTIICTIHQPRTQIFEQFDHLLLLAKGNQIYSGPRAGAENYFASLGYVCPEYENLADFYIDLLTIDSTTIELEEQSKTRINGIIEDSKSRQVYEPVDDPPDDVEYQPEGVGWIRSMFLITRRSFLNTYRDLSILAGKFIQALVLALMIAILWWQMDTDQTAIQDRFAVIFMILLGCAFPEAISAVLVFPLEREVFRREKKGGMYRISAYFIAKQFAELPLQILVPASFVFAVYWAVGLPYDVWKFGTFLCFCLLMAMTINSMGMVAGAILPAQTAVVMVPCVMIVALLLARFYVNPNNLPVWIEWAKYASVFFYSFEGVILSQFDGLDFYCKSDQYATLKANGTCSNGEFVSASEEKCPITSGQFIIDQNNADLLDIWQYQIIMLAFVLACRALIYPALKYCSPREANG